MESLPALMQRLTGAGRGVPFEQLLLEIHHSDRNVSSGVTGGTRLTHDLFEVCIVSCLQIRVWCDHVRSIVPTECARVSPHGRHACAALRASPVDAGNNFSP